MGSKARRIIASVSTFTALLVGKVEATTLVESVTSPAQSNVVFGEESGGKVEVSFGGRFDFSAVGGEEEQYSGVFTFTIGTPPISMPKENFAHYRLNVEPFQIFGEIVNPSHVTLLVQDGTGQLNDFLTFQVSFFDGPGLLIPGTGRRLSAIGLNAGAFPGTMLTSAEFPTGLDVFASAVGAGPPTQFAVVGLGRPLTVGKTGNGNGTVISKPEGINCGTDCSESFVDGTAVTLTATSGGSSTFAGWFGACTGRGPCVVIMDGAKTVTARFALALGPPVPTAPSGLTATAISPQRVLLTWHDSSTNEDDFRVEIRRGQQAFREVATVGTNRTRVVISNLRPGTHYFFRIRARNTFGFSTYSNQAFVRIPR